MRWKSLARSHSGVVGLVLVVAFTLLAATAPFITAHDPTRGNLRAALTPPGQAGYLLGTDELGRDTWSRIVYGSRISLALGLASVAFGLVFGVPLGMVSGYYGGGVDSVLMRVMDIFLAFPRILLAILVVALYGIGFWSLVFAIGVADLPVFARLVRSATLTYLGRDFVTAAKALGARDSRVMGRHILPNLVGTLAVQSTFSMAAAILIAGGLSFLGLGVQPPTPEWGSMLSSARSYMRVAPHLITYPGIALAVVVLGINLLGDALRQAYDPRFRGKDA